MNTKSITKRKNRIFFAVAAFIFGVSSLGLETYMSPDSAHATSGSGFDAGNIISDSIFTNSNSMDAGQIQNFLNSKVPVCDTNGIQQSEYGGGTRAQWAFAHGIPTPFRCLKDYTENGLSSAQIIYTLAKQYQINPQVLIVVLQKEQGLVTDTWPTPIQYKTATGYGCPDTAPCDTQYYGLTNQLTWTAKMFHSILTQNPNWYSPYGIGTNNIKWNPNSSCGASMVPIQNLSTAALYSYTPYRPNQAALNAGYGMGDSCSSYGNRNFYLYFSDWFGSTYSPSPIGASIFNQQSTGRVFLVVNGIRYYIPSWDMLTNYGLDKYGMITVDNASINNLNDGGNLTNLIYDDSGVYLVNNGARYHVSSDTCKSWGLDCLNGNVVKGIGSFYQTSGLAQAGELSDVMSYNGVVYRMVAGQRSPVADQQTMDNLGLSNKQIIGASAVNASSPLGGLLITTPSVITYGSTMYYYDGSKYFKIASPNQFRDWNLATVTQIKPQASSYDQTPPPSTPLASWIKSGSNDYVIDQGKKLKVPLDLPNLWPSSTYIDISNQPSPLFNLLAENKLQRTLQVNGVIYSLDDSGKRFVPTYSDYLGLGLNAATTTTLSSDKASSIIEGYNMFANGKIIALQDGTGRAFVVNNGKLTHIYGPDTFSAYGFDYGSVTNYPLSITHGYPIDNKELNSAIDQNFIYITVGSRMYKMSISDAQNRGIRTTTLTGIDSSLAKNAHPQSLSMLLNDDQTGKVYFVSDKSLHYVTSYSTYVTLERQYGVSHVNSATIDLFTLTNSI